MNCGKIDKYDYLIAMATLDAGLDDAGMFEKLDASEVVLSNCTINKINNLIKSSRKCKTKDNSKARTMLSRVAVIALVVMSIAFAAMMSVSAISNAIWNTIVEWYDKYISIDYKPEQPESVPATIEEIRKPTLLPQGAEEEIITNTSVVYFSEYYSGDECIMSFKQSVLGSEESYIDAEPGTMQKIKIGNFEAVALIYQKNDSIKILWNDGVYEYSLTGYQIDAETLVTIAQSVK